MCPRKFYVVARWAKRSFEITFIQLGACESQCSGECQSKAIFPSCESLATPYSDSLHIFKSIPTWCLSPLLNFFLAFCLSFCFSFHPLFLPSLSLLFKLVSNTCSEFSHILKPKDKMVNKSATYCFQGPLFFLLILDLDMLSHLS